MRVPPIFSALLCLLTTIFLVVSTRSITAQTSATEAPAAFDSQTNGFITQAQYDAFKATFEEREEVAQGLGPVYNAQSCAECHQNPVTGGISQVTELRAGHLDDLGNFVDAPGGSLINDRAIFPSLQEFVPYAEKIRTFRTSTNTLGNGFVEAISSWELQDIANAQPGQSGGLIAGQVVYVPVLEAAGPSNYRAGRFGWKNQHASLLSFSGDAYLNEMGITSTLFPTENTSLGRDVSAYDTVPDPEDPGGTPDNPSDIDQFTAFMRATKAPPRDRGLAATADAQAGASLFDQIGCGICHRSSFTTLPAGEVINQGAFTVPPALGNKVIHPYSDFLLHDVGTGDGIVQNGGQSTRNKLRTMPLWGARTRTRHMHDGESLTFRDAILRHGGEATYVTNNFRALAGYQQNQIVTFLKSM
jgi:CxxC motif-containing protein (DUF1111 family)